jgi:hypothetical protein
MSDVKSHFSAASSRRIEQGFFPLTTPGLKRGDFHGRKLFRERREFLQRARLGTKDLAIPIIDGRRSK